MAGLHDRSARPHRFYRPTPQPVVDQIIALRRERRSGKAIAAALGVSRATVRRVLRRVGLNKLGALEPAEPIRRYGRAKPGELLHIGIKKLGKFTRIGHRITNDRTDQSKAHSVGWEFVHVCIDDASCIAFTQIRPDERKGSACAFLKDVVAHDASFGVRVGCVMTDNGSCYLRRAFGKLCRRLGLTQIRTKPYTPKPTAKPSA